MELLRLGAAGRERPYMRDDEGAIHDLRPVTREIDGDSLAQDGIDRAREALRVGAPVARPAAVLCIGQNYAAHAAESGDPPPDNPILFFEHPNTVVVPHDDALMPAERMDWEVELDVVIARRSRYLESPDAASSVIAGYAVSNDVSERSYQFDESLGQWSKGKCCETFNPLGPALVPADEVSEQDLTLWSSTSGSSEQSQKKE